ncbi:stoned-A [Anopheles darlingi]|uniref:Stoned-A n=1 Tax=Anopheles darlingi TaxID=43151 RepID=W5JTU1_ANODA|nr:stoned-A [Anopheles darlingi]
MLKLPKGLKKKKKGKKSKKDQELFTEEELEQYRREHQNQSALNSAAPSDSEEQQQQPHQSHQSHQSHHQPSAAASSASVSGAGGEKSGETDEEWSKFAALTSGIDSVLKKTQGDLDRIKSTSFFQKVPTKVEQEEREREERERCAEEERRKAAEEAARAEEEKRSAAEELIGAVVELSDSDHNNSETEEDIFDTGYIDAIARGELPIAYVPESPVLESFDGPDPFDTSYAEKVIKGPEVSKRGKKLVCIGSAVEVLTGRVEGAGTGAAKTRRQRRGPQNLLLASFDEGDQQQQQQPGAEQGNEAVASVQKDSPALTLLDDPADLPTSNIEIDLSVSLHLNLQKQQQQQQQQQQEEEEHSQLPEQPDLDEFDELKSREPVLVAGSDNLELLLGKPEAEASVPGSPGGTTGVLNLDAFDAPESDDPFYTGFVERLLPATAVEDDEFDPRAITEEEAAAATAAATEQQPDARRAITPDLFSAGAEVPTPQVALQDLLSVSTSDLTGLGDKPLEVATAGQVLPPPGPPGSTTTGAGSVPAAADPFDTTAIDLIVAPGKAELKFLEEELLSGAEPRGPAATITHSLSDPDFDPRADDDNDNAGTTDHRTGPEEEEDARFEQDLQSLVQRKSSLSLHIGAGSVGNGGGGAGANRSKSVVFAVATPDLLKLDGADHSSVTKKPLTPYYSRESSLPDLEADPFDTSFVPPVAPTTLELSLLEQELTSASANQDDFNPRADEPADQQSVRAADLLGAGYDQTTDAQKVLTPARPGAATGSADQQQQHQQLLQQQQQEQELDPFDTTIAHNLQPGRTELKLLEDELIPSIPTVVTDILSDAPQEASSVFVKVLTPQIGGRGSLDFGDNNNGQEQQQQQRECEVDPFDTSIAENIGPGRTEIKLLEDELIDHHY